MRKFVLEEGWVPKKLDVYIDVPDTIDITHMRSKAIQPEKNYCQKQLVISVHRVKVISPAAEKNESTIIANEDIVSQLTAMGFNHLHCQKAAINTSNSGVEEAMTWLLSHMDDPDINDPISVERKASVDESSVETLVSFGFQEAVARKALEASGGNIERATEWIFSNPDASSSSMDTDAPNSIQVEKMDVPDESGEYKLKAFVSHMGTSSHCGNYVAHIKKDGRWVIFNDSKLVYRMIHQKIWATSISLREPAVD